MEKVFKTIENYLSKCFGTKSEFVLDDTLVNDESSDVYGIHSITILVKRAEDGSIHYKPIFKGLGDKEKKANEHNRNVLGNFFGGIK